LEERRKMLDAKRRKLTAGQSSATPTLTESPRSAASSDPFATLDVASQNQRKPKVPSTETDADIFLAQLEQDFLSGKRK